MMRYFKILLNRYKELSLKEFMALLRDVLFIDVRVFVYRFDLSQHSSRPRLPGIDGVQFKKGALHDLAEAKKTFTPLPWEFNCGHFDGVTDFFVAKNSGGILHISWIYFQKHPNRFLALGEREAEIKFCLTLPALRGRGIYPRVILSILDYLHSAGIERVFMCVYPDNIASIRGIEKAGFARVGKIRMRKIIGIQISNRYDTNRRVS